MYVHWRRMFGERRERTEQGKSKNICTSSNPQAAAANGFSLSSAIGWRCHLKAGWQGQSKQAKLTPLDALCFRSCLAFSLETERVVGLTSHSSRLFLSTMQAKANLPLLLSQGNTGTTTQRHPPQAYSIDDGLRHVTFSSCSSNSSGFYLCPLRSGSRSTWAGVHHITSRVSLHFALLPAPSPHRYMAALMGDAGLPSVTHRERVGQSEVCPGGTETAVLPERRWGRRAKCCCFLFAVETHLLWCHLGRALFPFQVLLFLKADIHLCSFKSVILLC